MAIIFLFIALGILVAVRWFTEPLTTEVIHRSENTTSNQAALEGVRYLELLDANLLFILVFVGVLGLVAHSVLKRGLL